VDPRLISMYID